MIRSTFNVITGSVLLGLAFFMTFSSLAEGPAAPVTLSGTNQFELTGTNNGRTYLMYVSVPTIDAPEEGFPVIYVTDASQAFPILIGPADRYARMVKETPAIIVGIGYPDGVDAGKERGLDLTPAVPDASKQMPGTGGAESFLSFITDDLKPVIEKQYPINTGEQTLMGHSYGGLFALYTLFSNSELFQNYVISSPSIWFGEKHILTLQGQLAPKEGQTLRIFLSVGEHEQSPTDKLTASRDNPEQFKKRMAALAMLDNAAALAPTLEEKTTDFEFRVLKGLGHMLAGRVAPLQALPFIFE